MVEYMTFHRARFWLPDQHLVVARVEPDTASVIFEYHWRHVTTPMVQFMDLFSRGTALSGAFELAEDAPLRPEDAAPDPPSWTAWIDRGPATVMRKPIEIARIGPDSGVEFRFVRTGVTKELVDELNQYVMPWLCHVLKPVPVEPPETV